MAMIVGFMEQACIQALCPYIKNRKGTVGVPLKITDKVFK
jgi:predicted thioesterase